MRIGRLLSCEEYTPAELLKQATTAEPWVRGAVGLCPLPSLDQYSRTEWLRLVRLHPAAIAQAVATSAVLTGGDFAPGTGSGDALNEHIAGARWPDTPVRLTMLDESVEVTQELWQDGSTNHHGEHYTVENPQLREAA